MNPVPNGVTLAVASIHWTHAFTCRSPDYGLLFITNELDYTLAYRRLTLSAPFIRERVSGCSHM